MSENILSRHAGIIVVPHWAVAALQRNSASYEDLLRSDVLKRIFGHTELATLLSAGSIPVIKDTLRLRNCLCDYHARNGSGQLQEEIRAADAYAAACQDSLSRKAQNGSHFAVVVLANAIVIDLHSLEDLNASHLVELVNSTYHALTAQTGHDHVYDYFPELVSAYVKYT